MAKRKYTGASESKPPKPKKTRKRKPTLKVVKTEKVERNTVRKRKEKLKQLVMEMANDWCDAIDADKSNPIHMEQGAMSKGAYVKVIAYEV